MAEVEDIEFWLDYMVDYYVTAEKTWEWAFLVSPSGEIIVRNGPFWQETGIYATKRRIIGCEWE